MRAFAAPRAAAAATARSVKAPLSDFFKSEYRTIINDLLSRDACGQTQQPGNIQAHFDQLNTDSLDSSRHMSGWAVAAHKQDFLRRSDLELVERFDDMG